MHSAQLGQLRSRWCAGRTARLRVKLPAWAAMATSAGRHDRRLNVGECSKSAQLLARVTGSLPVARTLPSVHGTFSSNCLAEAAMLRAAALHASLARSRATAKAPHQPFVAGRYASLDSHATLLPSLQLAREFQKETRERCGCAQFCKRA